MSTDGSEPKIGSYFKHYKGNVYKVIKLGMDESTQKISVLYEDLSPVVFYPWIRPLDSWLEMVDTPEGKVKRFTQVSEEEAKDLHKKVVERRGY